MDILIIDGVEIDNMLLDDIKTSDPNESAYTIFKQVTGIVQLNECEFCS